MNAESLLLEGDIVRTGGLSPTERSRMSFLMEDCFARFDTTRFERDLAEKPWTILLRAVSGEIMGFSTLDIMETRVAGRDVRAVYSGDTIIDLRHRATTALPRAFLRFLARHTGVGRDDAEWFWFYVCKGFRTYRFLPVFYRSFFPQPDVTTPSFEQQVMDHLARTRFVDAYDPDTGVVRVPGDYALREGVGDVTDERMSDPFIRFFAARNPGWMRGDELVCLVSLDRANLRSKPQHWLDQEMSA
jgi:hypothetical protein